MKKEAIRRVVGGTPDWCTDRHCVFYGTASCTGCEECAFCGANIGPKRIRGHRGHLMARIHGGVTWAPICQRCNSSQRTDGVVTWLRRLHTDDHEYYKRIVRHTVGRYSVWLGIDDKLSGKIMQLDEQLGGHIY